MFAYIDAELIARAMANEHDREARKVARTAVARGCGGPRHARSRLLRALIGNPINETEAVDHNTNRSGRGGQKC
jgi:hypothetical protein